MTNIFKGLSIKMPQYIPAGYYTINDFLKESPFCHIQQYAEVVDGDYFPRVKFIVNGTPRYLYLAFYCLEKAPIGTLLNVNSIHILKINTSRHTIYRVVLRRTFR